MIRKYLGKKAARSIERSRYGRTNVGRISTAMLDTEKLDELTSGDPSSVSDDLQDRNLRHRILWIALATNLVSWLSVIFLPFVVSKIVVGFALIFSKGGLLLILPAFVSTMLAVFALIRHWLPESVDTNEAADVMQSYRHQTESLRTWKMWVAACGAGAINSILLIIVYFYVTEEWQYYAR